LLFLPNRKAKYFLAQGWTGESQITRRAEIICACIEANPDVDPMVGAQARSATVKITPRDNGARGASMS
jgi:hypothetical protein